MLLAASRADAQTSGSLSIAGALDAAREASPEIAAAREASSAARARERQAGAFINPTLAYSREQASGDGQSTAQSIVMLDQPIEIGGVRGARRDAARLRREAADARVAQAEAEIAWQVRRTYALAVAADQRARLAEQAAGAFTQAIAISERRLAAGDISGYEHRRLRLEAARYATVRAEAELARRTARIALAALVTPRAETVGPFAGTLTDTILPREDALSEAHALVAIAGRSRSELRAAELELEATAAEARLAAHERIPVVVLFGGIKTETVEPGGGPSADLRGLAAGVSIPVPLWDRRAGAIAAAEALSRQRSAELLTLRRTVAREVHEAHDAWRAAESQVAALAPQLGAESRAALHAAQVAYTEGDIPLIEWLDAVRAYQEAEAAFATLRAEASIRRAALERAVGAPPFATSFTPTPGGER
jgi:outer membrane protein, heavy metal efflux system